jgi:hypothetical protein
MKRYGFIAGISALLLLAGCNEFQQAVKEAKQETVAPKKDNYIVLLDLSDRILYNNQQQVSKDIAVISSLYEVFKAGINAKDPTRLYYTVNDKLKILIAPQKTTPPALYEMVGDLRVELGNELPDKKAGALDSAEKKITALLPEIYKQAIISNNGAAYSGADIWKYFDEDLTDDLEKDAATTLFVITDGYMNFENTQQRPPQRNRYSSCTQIINALKKYPDWSARFDSSDFGLLPVGKKFSNLKVVLLQLNPKTDWNGEYVLLTKIWGKWLEEMGIRSYHFIKEDNINEVRESIEKFMQIKMSAKVEVIPWTPITGRDLTNVYTNNNTTTTVTFSTVSANAASAPVTEEASLSKKWVPASGPASSNPPKQLPEAENDGYTAIPSKDPSTAKPSFQKTKKDDDILNDAGPRKGFNTGLKKAPKNKK